MEEKYQFLSEENGDKINEDQTESFQAVNERKESMRDDMDQLMRAVKESNESVEKSSFLQSIHESLNSAKEALLSPSRILVCGFNILSTSKYLSYTSELQEQVSKVDVLLKLKFKLADVFIILIEVYSRCTK